MDFNKDINGTLRWKLKQASIASAAGTRSWDGFCEFLDDFETLAQLCDPVDTKACHWGIKRDYRQICYHLTGREKASGRIDTQMTAEVLAKIDKLVHSEIFPSVTDFGALVGWLDQLTFLIELTWPEGDSPVESLEQALTITEKLLSFCLNYQSTGKIEPNYSAFEKTCPIVKQGVSRIYGPTINLKAVKVMRKLAKIMGQCNLVEAYGKDFIDRISDELWSIVREDLRDMAKRCFACNYKMDKSGHETSLELYGEILDAISHLPPNIEALEFFLTKLGARSRLESDAVDLAILNRIVSRTPDLNSKRLWSILDIHMSRSHPKIQIECLKIARSQFGGDSDDDIIKAMFKHLDLIIGDTARGKSDDCRDIRIDLVRFLCSIRNPAISHTETLLTKLLKYAPVEHLNENITGPIEDITSLNADSFAKVAIERFRGIYRYVYGDKRDRAVALKALYKLIVMKGNENTMHTREYINIVAAGWQTTYGRRSSISDTKPLAPKSCSEVMFRVLNETKALVKEDNQMCLLPLARAVYEQID